MTRRGDRAAPGPMELFDRLWPIPRSLTGDGVRRTLDVLGEFVPIERREVPTGTKCFDWEVPREWNIRDAFVRAKDGRKLVDFKKSNLHVVGYSVPVRRKVKRAELLEHLHTLPELPGAIPYLTSYYRENWGFCVEHDRLGEFSDDEFDVVIDSTLEPGFLTYGEGLIRGREKKEVLFSTYVCHPSLANNELSGPIVQTLLYRKLREKRDLRYTYRFLYLPETIGAIVYLSRRGKHLKKNLAAGFVVTCVGDDAPFTYKKSRRGDSLADRAALNALRSGGRPHKVLDWFPTGSDERQYGSIGFDLPVGSLMRSMYTTYREYHTSLDNRDFISEEALRGSVDAYLDAVAAIEANDFFINTNPDCEPRLSKRGLSPALGSLRTPERFVDKILYLLAFSDGRHDLIEIADKMRLPAGDFAGEVRQLLDCGLLKRFKARSSRGSTRRAKSARSVPDSRSDNSGKKRRPRASSRRP